MSSQKMATRLDDSIPPTTISMTTLIFLERLKRFKTIDKKSVRIQQANFNVQAYTIKVSYIRYLMQATSNNPADIIQNKWTLICSSIPLDLHYQQLTFLIRFSATLIKMGTY